MERPVSKDELEGVRTDSELLHALADAASGLLAYCDRTLLCRFANRAYEQWFGVTPEAMVGQHISGLLGPTYQLNLPYIEKALRGEPQEFERDIPDPAGGPTRHSLVSYVPDVVEGVVHGFFVMVTDISRIKRAERALKVSEARFSGIVSILPDAIFSFDEERRIVLFNEGAQAIFGWTPEEVIGKPLERLIPLRFRKLYRRYIQIFARSRLKTRRLTGERPPLLCLRKSGEEFLAEAAISKLGLGVKTLFTVSLRDIGERKRTEEERHVFVALLDNSSDFISVADPTGRSIYVNAAGRRMVGLPADYPIRQTQILDFYPPEERTFAADVIVRSMLDRGHWSGETFLRNWTTGERIPVSVEHVLIRDPRDSRVIGTGTVTRNITEAQKVARERGDLLARERQAREQAEAVNEQLRESEERFRLTIDEAPIGMALVAPDGGFIRVNHRLCEIVGYTAQELAGLTFQVITHPEDLDADLALVGQLARGEIPRYQLGKRYVRKDGTIVDVMLSVSVLRKPDGAPRYFIAQIEDITERKQFEERLRLAEAKSTGILSISADAIISIDESERITMFNEGAEKVFGYSSAEAIGAPLETLIPEQSRAAHHQHIATFARGDRTSRQMGESDKVILGRRKSGELFPADAAISKLEVGGRRVLTVSLRDITEQKRIENEQRFLAEVGRVLGASLDYNQTLTRISELAIQGLADLCILEIVDHDEDIQGLKVTSRSPAQSALCELLMHAPLARGRSPLLSSVLASQRPALLQRTCEETILSLAEDEETQQALRAVGVFSLVAVPLVVYGRLLGVIAFVSTTASRLYGPADVRLAEELAQRAALSLENARLYRAAQLATEARDDVMGIVAHDLRNPLNSILLLASLLHSTEPERRSRERASGIERAAIRMNHLIQDLLDVTRIEAGRLSIEPVALSTQQLLADSIEAQKPLAASASLELRLDAAPELPEVWADRDRLLQVFENLIGNALKFTKAGGQITVGAAPREGEVLFWVSDTGSGIAPEDLAHLFDRFWQARKAERRGAGLGLSIVKGVVEAHRGRIWVESRPGQGSTFLFTIPSVRRSEPAPPAPVPRAP